MNRWNDPTVMFQDIYNKLKIQSNGKEHSFYEESSYQLGFLLSNKGDEKHDFNL